MIPKISFHNATTLCFHPINCLSNTPSLYAGWSNHVGCYLGLKKAWIRASDDIIQRFFSFFFTSLLVVFMTGKMTFMCKIGGSPLKGAACWVHSVKEQKAPGKTSFTDPRFVSKAWWKQMKQTVGVCSVSDSVLRKQCGKYKVCVVWNLSSLNLFMKTWLGTNFLCCLFSRNYTKDLEETTYFAVNLGVQQKNRCRGWQSGPRVSAMSGVG